MLWNGHKGMSGGGLWGCEKDAKSVKVNEWEDRVWVREAHRDME